MPSRLDELKQAFQFFDSDSDGHITVKELSQALTSLGKTTSLADAEKIVKKLDLDHNGTLDFTEFLTLMTSNESCNKKMTKKEAKMSRGPLHEQFERQLKKMFAGINEQHGDMEDKDFLDYDEFHEFMKQFNVELTELEMYDMFKRNCWNTCHSFLNS